MNQRKFNLAAMMNLLTIAASLAIIVSLTTDIVHYGNYLLTSQILIMQAVVSVIFIADYVVGIVLSPHRWRYALSHLWVLIVSLPYMNVLFATGATLTKTWFIVLKCLPVLRGFYGIIVGIHAVTPTRIRTFMWSYLAIALSLTYLSALLFYSFELDVNSQLHGFGNALWWAGMSFTTVGASFFAVTPLGKFLSVMLPGLGMVLFPIFTVYFTSVFQHKGMPK